MHRKHLSRSRHGLFQLAAVELLSRSGKSVDETAAELGVAPSDLRSWRRRCRSVQRAAKSSTAVDKLKAENQALRTEIEHLKVHWDILKTTLGILSKSVLPEPAI